MKFLFFGSLLILGAVLWNPDVAEPDTMRWLRYREEQIIYMAKAPGPSNNLIIYKVDHKTKLLQMWEITTDGKVFRRM